MRQGQLLWLQLIWCLWHQSNCSHRVDIWFSTYSWLLIGHLLFLQMAWLPSSGQLLWWANFILLGPRRGRNGDWIKSTRLIPRFMKSYPHNFCFWVDNSSRYLILRIPWFLSLSSVASDFHRAKLCDWCMPQLRPPPIQLRRGNAIPEYRKSKCIFIFHLLAGQIEQIGSHEIFAISALAGNKQATNT